MNPLCLPIPPLGQFWRKVEESNPCPYRAPRFSRPLVDHPTAPSMAPPQGFEPRPTEPDSAVLPVTPRRNRDPLCPDSGSNHEDPRAQRGIRTPIALFTRQPFYQLELSRLAYHFFAPRPYSLGLPAERGDGIGRLGARPETASLHHLPLVRLSLQGKKLGRAER